MIQYKENFSWTTRKERGSEDSVEYRKVKQRVEEKKSLMIRLEDVVEVCPVVTIIPDMYKIVTMHQDSCERVSCCISLAGLSEHVLIQPGRLKITETVAS